VRLRPMLHMPSVALWLVLRPAPAAWFQSCDILRILCICNCYVLVVASVHLGRPAYSDLGLVRIIGATCGCRRHNLFVLVGAVNVTLAMIARLQETII
jgi:hypothetical protein